MSKEIFSDIKLPEDIRQIYILLCNEFIRLNYEWNFYLEMYGNEANSVLLGKTARIFFETVEESFRYDMAMSICRLSDPQKSLGKYDNLCIDGLIEKCANIEGLNELHDEFINACKPIRKLRDKIISHSDLNIALKPNENPLPTIGKEQIDTIIDLFSKILNTISLYHGNTQELVFNPLIMGGAKDLIYWLGEGWEYYNNTLCDLKAGHIPDKFNNH
jgi:hypothetical protein